MTKLAILEEREEDKYDTTTAVKCWKCDPVKGVEILSGGDARVCGRPLCSLSMHELTARFPNLRFVFIDDGLLDAVQVKPLIDSVMHSLSSARQSQSVGRRHHAVRAYVDVGAV